MLSSNLQQNRDQPWQPIIPTSTLIGAASLPPPTRHPTIARKTSSRSAIGNRHAHRSCPTPCQRDRFRLRVDDCNQQQQQQWHAHPSTIPPPNNNATTTTINARPKIITLPPCVGHRVWNIKNILPTVNIYYPPLHRHRVASVNVIIQRPWYRRQRKPINAVVVIVGL